MDAESRRRERIPALRLAGATVLGAVPAAVVASLVIAALVIANDSAMTAPLYDWLPRLTGFLALTGVGLALLCGIPWALALLRDPDAPRWLWLVAGANAGLTGAALLFGWQWMQGPGRPLVTLGATGTALYFAWLAAIGALSAAFARLILPLLGRR